jgi:hypothetical protein
MDERPFKAAWFFALLSAVILTRVQTEPSREALAFAGPQAVPTDRGAGTITPPNQGYVPGPEPVVPGTTSGASIPSNPLDRAYWELYDPTRSVTFTGKVTGVDWTIPNTYIYLTAESGLWVVEAAYSQFLKASVTPAIRAGQTIAVKGYLPKEKPITELPARASPGMATYLRTNRFIRAGEITTGFGQKMLLGRPPTDAEIAERLRCSAFGCDLTPPAFTR